jgi:diacylglycerol kinase
MTRDPSGSALPETVRMPRQRSAWRQRLVDAERGVMQGIRGDSAFFVYFFLSSVTIAACVVLGISLIQWTIVILALTLVLSAEMFNQVLKTLLTGFGHAPDDAARNALRMAVAAVFVAITGSVIVIGLILGQAAAEMFAGG